MFHSPFSAMPRKKSKQAYFRTLLLSHIPEKKAWKELYLFEGICMQKIFEKLRFPQD